jgi:hypothetical protein
MQMDPAGAATDTAKDAREILDRIDLFYDKIWYASSRYCDPLHFSFTSRPLPMETTKGIALLLLMKGSLGVISNL